MHKEVGQTHSNRRSRFWNQLLGQQIVPFPLEGFWKQLLGLRNFVWIKKVYEGLSTRFSFEKKSIEVTAVFAAAASVLTILAAALSVLWFHRIL